MGNNKARCMQLGQDMLEPKTASRNTIVKDPRIEIALFLVAEGCVDPNRVANRLNLSLSRFRHLFRREVGASFLQFSKSYRLLKARRIFAAKNERTKAVMSAVGFDEISHFLKDYKSLFGETPSETRRHSTQEYAEQLRARIANK